MSGPGDLGNACRPRQPRGARRLPGGAALQDSEIHPGTQPPRGAALQDSEIHSGTQPPRGAALQGGGIHPGTQAFYERHAEQYHAATAHLDARALYDPFLKELPPGARILDAGCGSGRDTRAFAGLGYRVTAIDASPALARRATVFTGRPCLVLSLEELPFESAFDGIWACASLVHVSKRNVPDVMRRFLRALGPGGVLYLSLREGDGERIEEDGRFFNYYTAPAFRDAIGGLPAFRELACWTTSDLRGQSAVGGRQSAVGARQSEAVGRPSANSSRPTDDAPPPTADRPPTADCRPAAADCRLPPADCRPPTAWLNFLLSKASPASPVSDI